MIKVLAVGNEKADLNGLSRTIQTTVPDAELLCVNDPVKALKMTRKFKPDIAFLDTEMPEISGLALAKEIKEQVNPKANIIFITEYNEYIEEAFTSLRASGYLKKPITREKVLTEIRNLRYPLDLREKKRVRMQTFGNFEVFIDDKPVEFHYDKTKELCAYLVDHGGMCSIGELQECLWEETEEMRDRRSYLRNIVSDLVNEFSSRDCEDVIIRENGSIGIDGTKIDCDYYSYCSGNPTVISAFMGEYMTQYAWAKGTQASLVLGRNDVQSKSMDKE